MIIRNFGITLTQLTREDIELVRYWRNSKEISQFMEYQKFITEEDQKTWFQSLNPLTDFYFLINWEGQKIGLIHTSTIDWENKTAHAGLFIWDKNYLSTHIPVLASLSMLECFFNELGLELYFAKVGRENSVAINYNTSLGFKLFEKLNGSNFDLYSLEKSNYLKVSDKLRKIASRVTAQIASTEFDAEIKQEILKLTN